MASLSNRASTTRPRVYSFRLSGQPGFAPESVRGFPGEQRVMLRKAFERELAAELAWKPARVRELLGMPDSRPVLSFV
ncbi:hypothetical protein [Streptomyces sp. NPDC002640]|jgi:hypothetical protein